MSAFPQPRLNPTTSHPLQTEECWGEAGSNSVTPQQKDWRDQLNLPGPLALRRCNETYTWREVNCAGKKDEEVS